MPFVKPKIELIANGHIYDFWQSVEVTRALDALSGKFRLTFIQKAHQILPQLDSMPPLNMGDTCEIKLDGKRLIKGVLTSPSPSFSSTGSSISVEGKDSTYKLSKCHVYPLREWKNAKAETILTDVLALYGLSLRVETSTGLPIKRFKVDIGETAEALIKRLQGLRGFLVVTDFNGGLRIVAPATGGTPQIDLVEGDNLLSGDAQRNDECRFSHVYVLGESKNGKAEPVVASATDATVQGFQPIVIQANGETTQAEALQQARWALVSNNAKALNATVQVQGWKNALNEFWDVNRRVRLNSESLGVIQTTLAITAVSFSYDANQGSKTALSLALPACLIPEPLSEEDADKAKAKKGKKKRKKKGKGKGSQSLTPEERAAKLEAEKNAGKYK